MSINEQIQECVVSTRRADRTAHFAPMGVRIYDDKLILAPFKPSGTLDNLLADRQAVVNYVTDVRVIAGCLTGRQNWPSGAAKVVGGFVLDAALSHHEVRLEEVEDNPQRPRLTCKIVNHETHGAFDGFNRARHAVLELAVLVSRLDLLPLAEIEAQRNQLEILVEKTAGPAEREAWQWLDDAINQRLVETSTGL